jgi:hypothetical protein
MNNKTIDKEIDEKETDSKVLTTFDDISLCDNNSTNDQIINNIDINLINNCDK